jgi:SAM-dependent methyltransferase
MDPHIATNRANWNDRAAIHVRNATGFYGIDTLRNGGHTLHAIELAEVGDVAGKRMLHLQCHFGLDSLSWARKGAIVTGLDFSPPAIAAARDLALETGLAADFVEASVYDARAVVSGDFDIVFTSWGTLCWLPDVTRWAAVAASCLAPGGFLYIADAHPALTQCEQEDGKLVMRYDWQTPPDQPLVFDDAKTYTGDATELAAKRTYEWLHSPIAIAQAMIDAGLAIELIREHEVLMWQAFPLMVRAGGDRGWRLPDGHPRLPLSFSIKARKI